MDIAGIGTTATALKDILGMFFPDKTQEERDKMAAIMAMVQQQTDTNKTEASSPSVFVAGWRPFVGWVCGSGFGVQFVIGPLVEWMAALFGHPVKFPQMDLGTMMPMLLGMLGLGGMRSYEKVQGVNSGH